MDFFYKLKGKRVYPFPFFVPADKSAGAKFS